MIVTNKIKMDLANPGRTACIEVMQDDQYSRNLEIGLYSNGTAFTLPDDCTVLVRYCKPDEKSGVYDTLPDGTQAWEISGNVVIVRLAPQICTVPGRVRIAVLLLQGEVELNCFSVDVHVHELPQGIMESRKYVNVTGFLPQAKGAAVGQYFRVAATDAQGRVTALEGCDIPSTADAVQYTAQELTEEQQMQARANLGLYGEGTAETGDTYVWNGDTTGKDVVDEWNGGQTVMLSEGVIKEEMSTGTLTLDGGEPMEVSIVTDAMIPNVHAVLDAAGNEYGVIIDMGILGVIPYNGGMYYKSGLYVHTDMVPGGCAIMIPGYAFASKAAVLVPDKYLPTPDWNAAEGEPGHVLNRTHWAEKVDVSFDNDLTGREVLPLSSTINLVKISDYVLSAAECVGAVMTMVVNGQEVTENISIRGVVDISAEFGISCFMACPDASVSSGTPFVGVVREAGTVQGLEVSAGTYYLSRADTDGNVFYVSHFSALENAGEVVHKLDNKFLPDDMIGLFELSPLEGTLKCQASDMVILSDAMLAEMEKGICRVTFDYTTLDGTATETATVTMLPLSETIWYGYFLSGKIVYMACLYQNNGPLYQLALNPIYNRTGWSDNSLNPIAYNANNVPYALSIDDSGNVIATALT